MISVTMIQNREIVTLFSNAQPHLFPSNTAYHFTNRLPHLLKLAEPERWHVGVTEFSTLNTLDTIPNDLTIDVDIDNDPRFSKSRQMGRFQFFMSGHDVSKVLTEKDFDSRVSAMQHYHSNIAPTFQDCKIPWQSFTNGLAGVTQQMLSQSGYNTYLLFKKEDDGAVKVGVKYNDTMLSDTRFVLSPALQHLLLLDDPTGIQTLKSYDALKDRFVHAKDRTYCDFWYRIIPSDHATTQWPGFDKSMGTDPFQVLEALSKKYEFFTFEEVADGKKTVVKLKFKEMNNIVMVEFPDNFLQLDDKHDTLEFKVSVSSPQYEITDKNKKPIKDAYQLGKHIKNGTRATTTAFFMTDGSEIQLTRKTSAKPPKGYMLQNFKLTTYYAKTDVTQAPFHQRYRIPRGNYTLQTFIDTMKRSLANQSVILFNVKEEDLTRAAGLEGGGGGKRMKLSNSKNYTCTLKSTVRGYRITLHPRLQSILALERNVIRGWGVLESTRPILLSSFTYHLMLYCKFIKPNIQGGQFEPVLRTIPFPTQKQRGESFTMEFKNIEFHKLDVTALQDMSIEIRDDTGEVVQLNDGRTMLKLVFLRDLS